MGSSHLFSSSARLASHRISRALQHVLGDVKARQVGHFAKNLQSIERAIAIDWDGKKERTS